MHWGLQLRSRDFQRQAQGQPRQAGRQVPLRRGTIALQRRLDRGRLHTQRRRSPLALLHAPVGRGHSDVARPAAFDAPPSSPDAAAAGTAGSAGPGASLAGASAGRPGPGGIGADGLLPVGTWHPAAAGRLTGRLGSTVPGLYPQHRLHEPACYNRLVLRLKCYLSYDL